jgi:hypothetical protein
MGAGMHVSGCGRGHGRGENMRACTRERGGGGSEGGRRVPVIQPLRSTPLVPMQKPQHQTLSDYERVGELEFGLIVWRTNLKRDLVFAQDKHVGFPDSQP